jgi:hypothetical protein
MAHGGGSNRKPCSVEGWCTPCQKRGLCGKHAGYTRCRDEGCTKQAIAGGLCKAHGGGNKKPCSVEGCCTPCQKRGLCGKHGGR